MAFEVMKNAMQASIENNWGNLEKLPPIKVALTRRKFLSSYCRCWFASPTWTSRSKWATRVVGWTGWQLTRCSNTCTPLRPPQVSLQKLCPSLDLDMAYPSPDSMLGAKIWQTLVSYCFSLRYFQGDIKAASYENHGTDIYIYVQALAKESVSWSRWHDHWSSTQGAPFNLAVSCQVEKLPIWSETASSKMSTEREVQNWTYWQNHFESNFVTRQVKTDDWTDPDISHMDIGLHREGSAPCKLSVKWS